MGRTASKRTKKGDKISSRRKKTKRNESKKHRRHDYHSDSSFSDDSSLNSKPSPSSSSLSDYRKTKKSKKPRHRDDSLSSFSDDHSVSPDSKSRKRKGSKTGSKSSKKKSRKMYNSSDSGSDKERVTKHKRSFKPKKKSSKKKSKKHYSSSSDSDSLSGGSSIDADGKDRKNNTKTPSKKRKIRSPSFSKDEELSFSDEPVAPVNNPRRLKSVVIIVNPNREEEKEGEQLQKDEHKEEIVYDYDDYPSPRSLDSNEGGNDVEADNLSHGTISNKRIRVEDIESGEIVSEQEPANSLVKGQVSDKSVPVAVLGGDDLESILRQKALENLRMRKFKAGIAKSIPNKNMNNESDVKEQSSKSVDIVENKSVKLDSHSTRDVNKSSEFTEVVHKTSDSKFVGNKSGMSREVGSNPPKSASSNVVLESNVNPGGANIKSSSSSAIEPPSEQHSSEEKSNEDNASSEYEQKTMSVMRGGEMVQVSYKVYIPQRRPALGRRQLRQ